MHRDDLKRLTVKELRDLAARQGIARASKMSKEVLMSALAETPAASSSARPPRRSFTASLPPPGVALDLQAAAPPGLSSQAAAPVPASPPPPAAPAGPDPGLPIPASYGRTRLVLMVQDPHHIFAYWELAGDALHAFQRQGADGAPVLVIHTPHGIELRDIDLRGGNYYLAVAPDASYVAELAWRDSAGHIHALARSNRVTTPLPAVSAQLDEQWMSVEQSFHELLELSGLARGGPAGAGAMSSASLQSGSGERSTAWQWLQERGGSLSSLSLSSHSLSSLTRLQAGGEAPPAP